MNGQNQLPDAAGTPSRRKQCTPKEIQADVLVKEAARQAKADARAATAAAKATEKQAKVDVKTAKANTQTAKSKKTVAQLAVLHKPVNVPIQTPCPTNDAFSLHEVCQH